MRVSRPDAIAFVRMLAAAFMVMLLAAGSRSGRASEPASDDLLGDIVVEPSAGSHNGPRLMKVVVPKVEGTGAGAELVDQIVRRDLDLSGQFMLLDAAVPGSADAAEAIVRVSVRPLGGGMVQLEGAVFFDATAEVPAYETSLEARVSRLRGSAHELVDALIGTLTGYRGPFVSRLTFVVTRDGTRSVYVIDPDGRELHRITGEREIASASAFGPDDALYYAASVNNGRYRLYRMGDSEPLAIDPVGSIYGIAFSPDRERVAMTIARGKDIRLYTGPSDFSALQPVEGLSLALSPAISARGSIAVAGTNGLRPRIWVDQRAASPRSTAASAPDFCEHPDGTRLVYALGSRRRSDIVVADSRGRGARRITHGAARESHPACSPDGRLVAFFSTRRSGGGPGLYVMRIDGHHVRKISSIQGDALRWSRIAPVTSTHPEPAQSSAR